MLLKMHLFHFEFRTEPFVLFDLCPSLSQCAHSWVLPLKCGLVEFFFCIKLTSYEDDMPERFEKSTSCFWQLQWIGSTNDLLKSDRVDTVKTFSLSERCFLFAFDRWIFLLGYKMTFFCLPSYLCQEYFEYLPRLLFHPPEYMLLENFVTEILNISSSDSSEWAPDTL